MNVFSRMPIRRRLVALLLFPIVALSAFIFLYFPRSANQAAMQGLEDKAVAMTRVIRGGVSAGLDFNDADFVTQTFVASKEDADLVYIQVITAAGSNFTSYARDTSRKFPARTVPKAEALSVENGLLNISMPVMSGERVVGGLFTAFSITRLQDRISQERRITLAISILVLLLMTLLGLLLGTALARPIEHSIAALTNGAGQLAAVSRNVADIGQKMSESAGVQASNLEEVAASLEEMASITRQTAENAKKANARSRDGRIAVGSCLSEMKHMTASMDRIKESSNRMAGIIRTIDEIAFQTNLLALNAAIEAARAGESGRGFAVVAEEVRRLAHRSASSARETAALIEEAQKITGEGVSSAAEVDRILQALAQEVEGVALLVDDVAKASDQQASGIEQVNTAVNEMDSITQTSVKTAETSAATAAELKARAEELRSTVTLLTDIVHGHGKAATSAADNPSAEVDDETATTSV